MSDNQFSWQKFNTVQKPYIKYDKNINVYDEIYMKNKVFLQKKRKIKWASENNQ